MRMLLDNVKVLKSVPSVKEFTHVLSNMVLKAKATTWMIIHEPINVQNHIIKDH